MAVGQGQLAAILRGIGAPVTKQNMERLSAWQRAEGGSAAFNPFNTTQTASGASDYNSVGVKSYRTLQQGTKATIQTLENGRYAAILKVLRSNHGDFASAVGNSPWGTSGSLIHSILGGPFHPTAPTGGADTTVPVNSSGSKTFDLGAYRNKAATIMLNAAVAEAQGQPPQTDLLSALQKARASSLVTTTPLPGSGGSSGSLRGSGGTGIAGRAVQIAGKQIGTPYVWGGAKPGGFDCSGLVQWSYGKLGIKLPRTAGEMLNVGKQVGYGKLRPGDLIIEKNGDHVVMYAGNGRVVAAPHTGTNVQYQPLAYFPPDQYTVRRVVG